MDRFRATSGVPGARVLALVVAIVWPGSIAQAQPLAPARPGGFTGDCATVATRLAGLTDTRITAATTVPAGTLSVGGTPVPEHCLVTGRMRERTSAVDGNSYAIGFEMRLPKAWNGRFLHAGQRRRRRQCGARYRQHRRRTADPRAAAGVRRAELGRGPCRFTEPGLRPRPAGGSTTATRPWAR